MIASPLLIELARGPFPTEFGDFTMAEFTDGKEHAIALFKGDIEYQADVLCRIHSECVSTAFYYAGCDCGVQMRNAEQDIQREGKGIIIYLQQEGRGNGSAAHIATLGLKAQGIPQNEAYERVGFKQDKRTFDMAAKVLNYFNIKSVRLESNNKAKIGALKEYGIGVQQEDYSNHVIELSRIQNALDYANADLGLPPLIKEKYGKGKWIFIVGDLNVDYKIALDDFKKENKIVEKPKQTIGGTAYNAAIQFKEYFEPVIFGKVGNDRNGWFIKDELEKKRISAVLDTATEKPGKEPQATGSCTMVYYDSERLIIKDDGETNANDYDLDNLEKALAIARIQKKDYVFVVGHALTRCGIEHTKSMMELLAATGATIVFDMVPHNMYETVSLTELKSVIGDKVDIIIGEYNTFMGFLDVTIFNPSPSPDDIKKIFQNIPVNLIEIRYGVGNISHLVTGQRSDDGLSVQILRDKDTQYEKCPFEMRSGFGDILTLELLEHYDLREFPKKSLDTIPL
jgi:3,4-dihydroxy 2-butanone 4-phosphate synthase/GTP cyclohydrolase II